MSEAPVEGSLTPSSSSSREEDPLSPSLSPSPSAAPADDDDDLNPNPSSSLDLSPSSHHPASMDAPLLSAEVSLSRPLPSSATPPASVAPHNHSSIRRLPPPCWTREETDSLIRSYRQKWYGLRRGNLRASHWEEVAEAISRSCRHLYTSASLNNPKTAVQCRHKMEKLRKRYRSEKKRPHRTSWVHFRDMDTMEMGTAPSAVASDGGSAMGGRPKAPAASSADYSDDNEEDDESDEEDDKDDNVSDDVEKNGLISTNTRSIHAVTSKTNGAPPAIGNLRFQIPKAVRSKASTPRGEERANASHQHFSSNPFHAGVNNGYAKEFTGGATMKPQPSASEGMRKMMEERRKKEREEMLGEMVAAVRMLGDGFIRVEEMKMEMAREMEKVRMEMELKRTEMILESQRRIVDTFLRGATHEKKNKKRLKVLPES